MGGCMQPARVSRRRGRMTRRWRMSITRKGQPKSKQCHQLRNFLVLYWNIQNISPEQSSNLISNHIINTPINSDLCGEFNRRRRHTATKSTQDVDVSSSQCNGLGFEKISVTIRAVLFLSMAMASFSNARLLVASLLCEFETYHTT